MLVQLTQIRENAPAEVIKGKYVMTTQQLVSEQFDHLRGFAKSADPYIANLAQESIRHLALEFPKEMASLTAAKGASAVMPTTPDKRHRVVRKGAVQAQLPPGGPIRSRTSSFVIMSSAGRR
jgi:hypothetical protein